jgi:DNA phosphorothioation-associated putative methyltransferase
VLDVRVVAAGPGIFYAFKDPGAAQSFLATQVRRESVSAAVRINERLFDANRELLDELGGFVTVHERLPAADELPNGERLVERFGTIRAAYSVVRLVTGQGPARSPRVSEAAFAENRELLEGLVAYLSERGRIPEADELATAPQLIARFGSLKAASRLVERVLGTEQWHQVRQERCEELRLYLALAAFGGRARLSELPIELQRDIRSFFGSYKAACEEADHLLFAAGRSETIDAACRSAPIGKLTMDGFYVHRSALGLLPSVLRVFEGCGRVLAGSVPAATLVKLSRSEPKLSYLSYPDFDTRPHPALRAAVTVFLPQLRLRYRSWADSDNPPILHRKELFVPADYPGRERFALLTRQEERAGLFEEPARIGTQRGWDACLEEHGVTLRGHRLVRA